jgi:hypothetical protein
MTDCVSASDFALRAWGFALRASTPQDDGTSQLNILRHQFNGTNNYSSIESWLYFSAEIEILSQFGSACGGFA